MIMHICLTRQPHQRWRAGVHGSDRAEADRARAMGQEETLASHNSALFMRRRNNVRH